MLAWEPVLGHFAFNVTTASAMAQRLFNVGLLLLYNFDQSNAKSAFRAALAADPRCAMCLWGLAHACGPFLNQPTKGANELALGRAAAVNASELLRERGARYTAKEHAFIDSMALRYPCDPSGDQLLSYRQYADRLRALREAGGAELAADPDLMVFDAEAIMVLMCDAGGYHFYVPQGDSLPPIEMPATKEASQLLRRALAATNQTHPYAQHLLIHSTEMSNSEAETAVAVAAQLLKNMAGLQDQHLQHMTSHTFLRTGFYHQAVEGNKEAVRSDAAYLAHGLVPYGPGHNSAFLVSSAMWGGERKNAYKYAQLMQQIFEQAPGRRDGPDGSMAWSYPMMVSLRFGDWAQVGELDRTPPGDFSDKWPYGFGVLRHFGLMVAAAQLGKGQAVEEHLQGLRSLIPAVAALRNEELMNLTRIANHTASAVRFSTIGDADSAVQALEEAVDVEMSMRYNEPPSWVLPSRECYGQALLHAGRPRDAERVFRAALYGFSFHAEPRCGWALFGLRQSLQEQAPSGERDAEIEALTKNMSEAWRHADVKLTSACLHLGPRSSPKFV